MGGNIASKFQRTIEYTRNVRKLLYYFHITMYNIINCKCPRVPIVHFYKLVLFNIQRYFRASLSIRLSGSIQPVKCTRQYCTNNTCHKLHHYIPARSMGHRTLLHNTTIIHMKKTFVPACHLYHKMLYKTKLSHCTLLHFRTRLILFKHRFH